MKRPATTAKMKLDVLKKFGATVQCAMCDVTCLISEIEYDHRHQLSQGGDHSVENLRPLCELCHSIKTNGTKATTYGSDKHAKAKERRLRGENKPRRKASFPKRVDPWNKALRDAFREEKE